MKQSKRLQEIFCKNREFEEKSPYNFCDRWCQRCAAQKQLSCKLYHGELEQQMTCIAYGRNEDDPEVAAEVMRRQAEEAEGDIEENNELSEVDFDDTGDPELLKIKKHIEFVENNLLPITAEQYHKKAHRFLKDIFYEKKVEQGLVYDFETIAWYHTLLPVKLQRALAGFHEAFTEGDIALYDAVAQFEICRKAMQESIKALINLKHSYFSCNLKISELLALLHNILSRIELMEERI